VKKADRVQEAIDVYVYDTVDVEIISAIHNMMDTIPDAPIDNVVKNMTIVATLLARDIEVTPAMLMSNVARTIQLIYDGPSENDGEERH